MGSLQVRFTTATMQIRGNRTAGLGRTDLEILKEHGFQNFDEYWFVAMSQEMELTEFIRLLEAHLLDPRGFADEVHQQRLSIGLFIEKSLREAWENGETWFVGRGQSEFKPLKSRLHPREAAEWILQRPLHRDRLPVTLCDFLTNSRAGGLDVSKAFRSRPKRDAVIQFLRTKFPPHGVPPIGKNKKALLNEVNEKLDARIDRATLGRAIKDLELHLPSRR